MVSGSDGEGSSADQQFVLDHLATMEKARGLSPGASLLGLGGGGLGLDTQG